MHVIPDGDILAHVPARMSAIMLIMWTRIELHSWPVWKNANIHYTGDVCYTAIKKCVSFCRGGDASPLAIVSRDKNCPLVMLLSSAYPQRSASDNAADWLADNVTSADRSTASLPLFCTRVRYRAFAWYIRSDNAINSRLQLMFTAAISCVYINCWPFPRNLTLWIVSLKRKFLLIAIASGKCVMFITRT